MRVVEVSPYEQIDILQEEVRQLREANGFDIPLPLEIVIALRLTPMQAKFMAALLHARGVVTKYGMCVALYGFAEDAPDPKVLDVMLTHIRKKLRPHDVTIETLYGTGYRLTPTMKQKLRDMEGGII